MDNTAAPVRADAPRLPQAWRATNLDLLLATVVAIGLPFAAAWLWQQTGGASASLALYYGVCCVALVWWRRGTLGYRRPARWPRLWLGVGLAYLVVLIASNAGAYQPSSAPLAEVVFTAVVWGALNGAMEQLVWIYVLDAWRTRWERGWQRRAGVIVGWALMLALVGLIHVVFWIQFLPEASRTGFSWLPIVGNTVLTVVYVRLYDVARSMWPVFVLHLLVDLQLVLLAWYSIVPAL